MKNTIAIVSVIFSHSQYPRSPRRRPAQRLHTQAEFRLSIETIRMARMGDGPSFA